MIQKADDDTGEDKASAKEHDQRYYFPIPVGHLLTVAVVGVPTAGAVMLMAAPSVVPVIMV